MEVLKRQQYREIPFVWALIFISTVSLAQESMQMPSHTQKPAAIPSHPGENENART